MTWEKGRQLHSFDTNTYTYNANGIRTSKTVDGVLHTYLLDGAKILRETWGENVLETLWDNEDAICGIKYNGASYYFLKNLQGDIIAITDNNGAVIARYSYDAWGVCTINDSTSADIATINPFRYRGYYYDSEIGMYYLQSRYYDPVVARFVNADEATYVAIDDTICSCNLYAYCKNLPVIGFDMFGFYGDAGAIPSNYHNWVYLVSAVIPAVSAAKVGIIAAVKAAIASLGFILIAVGLIVVALLLLLAIATAAAQIMSVINSAVKNGTYDKDKNKKGYVVYVLTKRKNKPDDIFYVGRTSNYSKRIQAHKVNKTAIVGTFYDYIVFLCDSLVMSRLVEQAVLSACIFSKLFDIDKGEIPNGSNRIRGIAKDKIENFKGNMDELKSLLTCTADSDVLSLMGV